MINSIVEVTQKDRLKDMHEQKSHNTSWKYHYIWRQCEILTKVGWLAYFHCSN